MRCEERTCELCSWRGLASLPSRPMGELMRLRCESVDAYVSLFSTCRHKHQCTISWTASHNKGASNCQGQFKGSGVSKGE